MKVLTKTDISEKYPALEWRRRLLRIVYLNDFLSRSIIEADYRISDTLNNAIVLTDVGSRVLMEATRRKIPTKEAKLMCFLELYRIDMLVDVDATNIEAIENVVHEQVHSMRLKFPPIYGRQMYDRAAQLFEEQEESLSTAQTRDLLNGLPQGVYQLGSYVVGPMGLVNSIHERWMPPSRRVPLFHCSDPSCVLVHQCDLSTDWDASINEKRSEFRKVLDRESKEYSEWAEFIGDLVLTDDDLFDDFDLSTLPYLLGDVFDEDELRKIVGYILDHSNGDLRASLRPMGLQNDGSAEKIVRPLDRGHLLQILLTRSNASLVQVIDELVYDGVIGVPATEVRRPVMMRRASSTRYAVRVEIGEFGYRVVSDDTHLAPLRLRRLIGELYPVERLEEEEELDWQLRTVEGPSVVRRLEDFLRNGTPKDIIQTLIFSKRANVVTASVRLGIDDNKSRADPELLQTILWKLGFPTSKDDSDRVAFWRLHDRMEQMTRTSSVSDIINFEDLRGVAANYFVSLERVLADALLYTTWALVYDHYAADKPFTYIPDVHRQWAIDRINAYTATAVSDDESPFVFEEDKVTLYPLCRSFRVLADLLRVLRDAEESVRSSADRPIFEGKTTLQAFPFDHIFPFLDLLPNAQQEILETLDQVSRNLLAANVAAVRNEQVHYRRRRSSTDIARLGEALAVVRDCVSKLEARGFVRIMYKRIRKVRDDWGREMHILRDEDQKEHAFLTPSIFAWLRLPTLNNPQYVMTSALFSEPNEVLRFKVEPSSGYSEMWSNYPQRRKRRSPITPLPRRQEGRVTSEDAFTDQRI